MGKNIEIRHRGRVCAITQEGVKVEILNKSMCAACHARSLCSLGDEQIKTVSVKYCDSSMFSIGEEVEVVMRQTMGLKAVLFSYVYPLIILMILLLSLPRLNINELFSALLAVLAVAAYYLFLYLCRGRIAKSFIFTIAKLNN